MLTVIFGSSEKQIQSIYCKRCDGIFTLQNFKCILLLLRSLKFVWSVTQNNNLFSNSHEMYNTGNFAFFNKWVMNLNYKLSLMLLVYCMCRYTYIHYFHLLYLYTCFCSFGISFSAPRYWASYDTINIYNFYGIVMFFWWNNIIFNHTYLQTY